MPSIRSLFKQKPHGDHVTVENLKKRIDYLNQDLLVKEHYAKIAYLEAETDDENQSQADVAAAAIQSKKEEIARAMGALEHAEKIQAENKATAADALDEAAWRKTEKLIRVRQDKSVEVETLILKLVDAVGEIQQLGTEIYETAPVRVNKLHNSLMGPQNIEKALRLYFFKKGFTWSTSYPWNKDDIQNFSDIIKAGNTAILSNRPKEKELA